MQHKLYLMRVFIGQEELLYTLVAENELAALHRLRGKMQELKKQYRNDELRFMPLLEKPPLSD